MVLTVSWDSNNKCSIKKCSSGINVIIKGLICLPKSAKAKSSSLMFSLRFGFFIFRFNFVFINWQFGSSLFVVSVKMAPNGLYFFRLPTDSCQAMLIQRQAEFSYSQKRKEFSYSQKRKEFSYSQLFNPATLDKDVPLYVLVFPSQWKSLL